METLDIRLQVFEYYANNDNNYSRKSFRFAVVDLSKSKTYPQNFVCMLPVNLGAAKSNSVFLQLFGEQSLEQAKALLKAAWEREDDSEIKAEIERRLSLLEPKGLNQIKCSSCGKTFQPKHIRKFKKNFCEECMQKKFERPSI
jgi:DNA-directed RNA polymerase subunit RPC12/RpoP